jgi:hypothetical protein
MDRTESANSTCSCEALEQLLLASRIKLCEPQRRRLAWLVARHGAPVVWDRQSPSPRGHGVVIVVEPPTGPSAESFYRALHSRSVVVVPFGENPAFDFLKSKLRDFGTIGTSGADGPHEFWWGGTGWSTILHGIEDFQARPKPVGASKRPQQAKAAHDRNSTRCVCGAAETRPPLIVSCYPRNADPAKISRLTRSIEALGLVHVVEAIDTAVPERLLGYEKASFIQETWTRQDRPVLWVDPNAVLASRPAALTDIDCDFAVHKWNRWEMGPRTLYFGRSNTAEALLNTWHCFTSSYPEVWEGYLLDQAWSTVASQVPIETLWLPRSYHAAANDPKSRSAPVIIHDFETTTENFGPDPAVSNGLRVARRASRIGAPESLVVMKSTADSERAVTVILRDVQTTGARALAANLEAITRAFAADPGGYGHLELSLCPWREDVMATISAAGFGNNQVLEIAASDDLTDDLFRRFSQSADRASRRNVVQLAHPPKNGAGRTLPRVGPAPTLN